MRKQKQFTEEQKLQLLKSPYIEKVHSNHLEYTLEFKQQVGRFYQTDDKILILSDNFSQTASQVTRIFKNFCIFLYF